MAEKAREITANNIAELGRFIRQGNPGNQKMAGMTDEEIGNRALELKETGHPKYQGIRIVEGLGDISLSRTFANPLEDIGEVVGEQWEGLKEMISSPRETIRGMGRLAKGGLESMTQGAGKKFDHLEDLLKQGMSPEAAMQQTDRTEFVETGEERDFNKFVDTSKFRLSPAGFEENPFRFTSDAADLLPIGNLKRLPTVATKLDNLSMPSRIAMKTAGLTLDPASMVTELPTMAAGATAKAGSKAFSKASDAVKSRKLRLGAGELIGSPVGFTTSLGSRFVQELRNRFNTQVKLPGGNTARFDDVWRTHRAADMDNSTMSLLQKSYKAMDKWQAQLKKHYTDLTEKAFHTEAGPNTLKIRLDEMFGEAEGILDQFGFDVKRVKKKGPDGEISVEWRVVAKKRQTPDVDPKFGGDQATITDISSKDRRVVARQFERFLNEPAEVFAHEVHNLRILLDDNITRLSGDGASGRTKAVLTELRNAVAGQLELEMPGDYVQAMRRYTKELELIDRADAELGIRPGMVRPKTGDLDMRGHQTALNRLGNIFSDNMEHAQRLRLLERIQELGGDQTIIPALMGIQASPIAGSGLVVRSELSQLGRALIGVGLLSSDFGALAAIPAFVMFSPRLMTEALATLSDISNAPRLRAQVNKIIETSKKAKKLDEKSGGRLANHARITGMNIAQWIERVEQEAGVNLGEEQEEAESAPAESTGTNNAANRLNRSAEELAILEAAMQSQGPDLPSDTLSGSSRALSGFGSEADAILSRENIRSASEMEQLVGKLRNRKLGGLTGAR